MNYAILATMAVLSSGVSQDTPPPVEEYTTTLARVFLDEPLLYPDCTGLPEPNHICNMLSTTFEDPHTALDAMRSQLKKVSPPDMMLDIVSPENTENILGTLRDVHQLTAALGGEPYLVMEIATDLQPGHTEPDYIVIITGTAKTAVGYAYLQEVVDTGDILQTMTKSQGLETMAPEPEHMMPIGYIFAFKFNEY